VFWTPTAPGRFIATGPFSIGASIDQRATARVALCDFPSGVIGLLGGSIALDGTGLSFFRHIWLKPIDFPGQSA
jgi:hypothetical protein